MNRMVVGKHAVCHLFTCVPTRAQFERRGEEVARLDATNHSVKEEQQELMRKLSQAEHSLQTKTDDCQNLQIK